MESKSKKMKLTSEMNTDEIPRCKYFVQRKKRYCKMTVSKGKDYCGEHEIQKVKTDQGSATGQDRIVCPLDLKHTVYRKNLRKHLKICNARPKPTPNYIVHGVNNDTSNDANRKDEDVNLSDLKLSEVDPNTISDLIKKLESVYNKYIKNNIDEVILEHQIMSDELKNEEYGKETLKHIKQTSSILGHLEHLKLLEDSTCYIEFGAGKGQVSYWLGKLIDDHKHSKVLLIDKASHRHKKDNKLQDKKDSAIRIRADIGDFCLEKLDLLEGTKRIIGVSKHLCGAATDLALRCLLQKPVTPVHGFIIALCCHHRCVWKTFIGKEFLKENDLNANDFILMTKMASWAICGSGFSREKRKELEGKTVDVAEENNFKMSRERRTEIGQICKRIIDFARTHFMNKNNFDCSLKYYVKKDVTLENVCIVGRNRIV